MGEYNLSSATTTDISVPDFIVDSKALDTINADGETFWYFSDATKNMGYYSEIPEINSAANALATWSVGKGWTTADKILEQELKHIKGQGKDTFDQVMWNHEVIKLVVGDAFAEVKKSGGVIQNIIPISPERVRIVLTKSGQIKRYDAWNGSKWTEIKKENMLHSSNKRIGDQIPGTSQIDATKWVIDARNEALITNRMLEKRGRALGIVYYETNNTGKITFANEQIEKAVKNGQMVGLPKGTAEIKEFPMKPLSDRMDWIRYLENFFYQTFGVPRSIATSDGTSEVGGKMGHVIFEPIYTKEQMDLEGDLWNQQSIEITFNRPPSLGGLVNETEAKNTGQTNIQPNDVEASLTRE